MAALKRQIYDQVGGAGGDGPGVTFFSPVDPHEVFKQFFGTSNPFGGPGSNPFDMFMGAGTSGGGSTFTFGGPGGGAGGMDFTNMGGGGAFSGFRGHQQQQKQDEPIHHVVELSLEDLFHGCTKKMKISHKILTTEGTSTNEEKVLTIDVKPGWKAGTKITFPREGDQSPGRIPADIVFIIGEKQHEHFTRDGNDLRYKAKISLKQALCGVHIKVPMIDGKPFDLNLDEVITPESVKVYDNKGMPISKHPGQRGSLLVHFDIQFPTSLSDKDIKTLKGTLPD